MPIPTSDQYGVYTRPASGTIHVSSSASLRSSTGNKIWASGSNLWWGNTQLDSGGGGASSINDLSDALVENNSIWIGDDPSDVTSTAEYNTSLGLTALDAITTGDYNTTVGYAAGGALTDSAGNAFFGTYAGEVFNHADGHNTLIGYGAGRSRTGGTQAVSIGSSAHRNAGSSNSTVAIGYQAGYYNTGSNNVHIGAQTAQGDSASAGNSQVYIGKTAGYSSIAGDYTIGIGRNAGYFPEGNENIWMGHNAGYGNTTTRTANSNIGIGYYALDAVTSATQNTAIGWNAGKNITSAAYNTLVGAFAGQDINTGNQNVMIGYYAGHNITDLYESVIIGQECAASFVSQPTHGRMVYLGYKVAYNSTGSGKDYEIGIGFSTLGVDKSENAHIAIGGWAGYYLSGSGDGSIMLGQNAFVGKIAGSEANASIAIGGGAGEGVVSSTYDVFIGGRAAGEAATTNSSVVIGFDAGRRYANDYDGVENILIGRETAYYLGSDEGGGTGGAATGNTIVGVGAGMALIGGDKNVILGYKAGPSSAVDEDNKLYIHNAVGTPLIGGDFSADEIYLNGDVGIGTTSPATPLHVSGASSQLRLSFSSTKYTDLYTDSNGDFFIDNTGGPGDDIFIQGYDNTIIKLRTSSTNGSVLLVNESDAGFLTISETGTTSPKFVATTDMYYEADNHYMRGDTFRIGSGSAGIGQVKFIPASGGTSHPFVIQPNYEGATGGPTEIQFRAYSSNVDIMRLTDNARVGIGTTAPSNGLSVVGVGATSQIGVSSDGTNYTNIYNDSSDNFIINPSADFIITGADDGKFQFGDDVDFIGDSILFQDTSSDAYFSLIGSTQRVGIGTTAPGFPLVVSGNQYDMAQIVSSHAAGSCLDLDADATGGANWRLQSSADGAGAGGGKLVFAEDGNIRMIIAGGGNVGIGTTGPNAKLEINTVDGSEQLRLTSGSTNYTTFTQNKSDFTIKNSGSGDDIIINPNDKVQLHSNGINFADGSGDPYLYIQPSGTDGADGAKILNTISGQDIFIQPADNLIIEGNVGIGTAAPSQYLEIYESGTSNNNLLLLKNEHASGRGTYITHTNIGAGVGETNTTIEGLTGDNSGDFIIKNQSAAGELRLGTNNTDRLTIDIDGNVGIGTTAPAYELDVASTDPQIALTDTNCSRFVMMSQSCNFYITDYTSSNTNRFNIQAGGEVGIGDIVPTEKLDVDGNLRVRGDTSVESNLIVTGSTLAVQKAIKNDITADTTLSDSYSHYLAHGDAQTISLTLPASPTVGDEYWVVARTSGVTDPHAGALPGQVQIQAGAAGNINVVDTGSYIAIGVSNATTVPKLKISHIICIEANTWAMSVSDELPTS